MKKIETVFVAVLAAFLFSTQVNASEVLEVDIHGFISEGYLAASDNDFSKYYEDNDYLYNEVGLNFSKEFNDSLRFGIQFFSRDFIDIEMNDVKIDWAYADYAFGDEFGIRAGQIKIPHGLYNESRDVDMLQNPVFLPESVYHELSQDVYVSDIYLTLNGINSRDLYLSLQGLGVYGTIDMNNIGELSYQAMYGTQGLEMKRKLDNTQITFFSDLFGMELPEGSLEGESLEVDYKYAGNLIWDTPLQGLRLGASLDNINMDSEIKFAQSVAYDLPGVGPVTFEEGDLATIEYKKMENWVGSVEYTWGNLILMTEFIKTNKEYRISINTIEEDKKSDPYGWYMGGALRLTDWLEVGTYYSISKNNDMDLSTFLPPIDYFLEFEDISGTLRFDLNPFWTIKLEAHRFKGLYAIRDEDNLEALSYLEKENKWNCYTVKMTAAF